MPSASSPPRKPPAALTRAQGDDVLRYWLASVRLEEALQARPGARQAAGGAVVPRLDQPSRGQDYFKVPMDGALTSLLAKGTDVQRAFDAELCGFFEGWLHRQYRRSEEEGELSHLLCFPVVHLPKGDLAGVLRVGVRLRFGAGGGAPFRAPSRAERQRGAYPAPPTEVRLTRGPKTDDEWPFFVDTRLLWQTLGTPAEHLDAFFEALRSLEAVSERRMLALLTVMLEDAAHGGTAEPASPSSLAERLKTASREPGELELEGWLTRLTEVVGRLLTQRGSRARVYGVGIVVDGTQAKTTWHLQRELDSLLDGERGRWKLETPLGAYLTGKPLPAGEAPQRALFNGPGLTTSQRTAADSFWGSRFSAVQGPPGTGKTRLILHLCAEHLTRHVEGLLGTARYQPGLLVVTSSNNRAVDNVLEPLTEGEGLPLALRAGSRQVCEHVVATQLRRTLSWLKRAEAEPLAARSARLADAKRALRERGQAVEGALAPRRVAAERAVRRARLERALAELGTEDSEALPELGMEAVLLLVPALERVLKRFEGLSRRCEGPASQESLAAVGRFHEKTTKRHLPNFRKALAAAQLTVELPELPPALTSTEDVEQQMEQWEEAAERGVATLRELREQLQRAGSRSRLREELEQLGPETVDETFHALEESLSRELFAAAVAAREAWAAERATELASAVTLALRTVDDERSLRPLFRAEPDAARLFCRLFCVWGSTLLSLGNCLPADLGSVARVVIDEAGQCHPAHAVSALLRADAALVIGDVHQLTPVVELGKDDEARLLRSCRLATPPARLAPYRVHADAEVSSQSLADRAVLSRGLLTDHFRCQPEIIALSDELCGYGLTVHTARADRTRHAPFLTAPVSLVDLRGAQASWTGSWWNALELEETLSLLDALLRGGVRLDEVAIITPYRGQLDRLRRGLVERRIPLESSPELAESGGGGQQSGVALGTVHRFQGGERSVVLFSSVVTQHSSLGFLDARPNLLNVAISRAQHHFVCLGDASVLARGSRTRVLVNNARALPPRAYGSGLLL